MVTIDVEHDVRRQYNRRVLFCIRIRGAALLIGLWDLLIHSAVLFALIFMFTRPEYIVMDGMSNSDRFNQPPVPLMDSFESPSQHLLTNNKNFVSSSLLLSRILAKHNTTSRPPVDVNARHFYTNLDLMTIKWIRSLNQHDRYTIFFIAFSAMILTLVHIWGVLHNKPSYIVPYFLIKVFNVLISIFSMLSFYSYLPDITIWLRMQPDFPLKSSLLELDTQTLQLVIFVFLLFMVMAKLYIAAIIWYCYGYITALNVARSIGIVTADRESSQIITGDMYSPPKYEEAIQYSSQQHEDYSPPPYTPLLSS